MRGLIALIKDVEGRTHNETISLIFDGYRKIRSGRLGRLTDLIIPPYVDVIVLSLEHDI